MEVEHKEAALLDDVFSPVRILSNGHVQTLAGNFLRRRHPELPPAETRLIQVESATESMGACRVLCRCHWQPIDVRSERTTLILLHGLEGSSESQYVLGNTARAWAQGCNVVRMNMRNCGGSEHLSPTLYHSGYSADVRVVMEVLAREFGLQRIALVGYSMGGNLVLKLAGDLGDQAPAFLKAVVGISPAMDLAASADALHEPRNRVYEWKFLRGLLKRFERKVELFPVLYDLRSARGIKTLRDFDDRITARYSGFSDADDYYARSSSARVAERITVPTLVIHALDDPFVRMLATTRKKLMENPRVRLIETRHGGHCAFLSGGFTRRTNDDYWAERMLLRFILAQG